MIFQLFKKSVSKPVISDFSSLGVDMHSHLVPGVDDGSDSVETSITMIKGLRELGYRKIITTPHIRPEYFPNTPETILAGFEKLQNGLKEAEIDIPVACAAEYFVDYDFRAKIDEEKLLTFSGNHVLIELSTFSPPPNLFDTIFQMRIKGYQPVMAHPERYVYYQLEEFKKLKDFGCLLQCNILSLAGHYGKQVKELAHKLMKAKLIDLLGTDMHHLRHLDTLKKITESGQVMNTIADGEFRNSTFL